jgi:hypothetical protein
LKAHKIQKSSLNFQHSKKIRTRKINNPREEYEKLTLDPVKINDYLTIIFQKEKVDRIFFF